MLDVDTVEAGGEAVCRDCRDNYYSFCESCETYAHAIDMVSISYYDSACQSCIDGDYGYCDSCDGYYQIDDGGCQNDECMDCSCESPLQSFTVRNDGHEPLANDTRTTVSLPAGELSAEGIGAIQRLIQNYAYSLARAEANVYTDEWYECRREQQSWFQLSYRIEEIGGEWQNRQGNYTKRLSRFAYQKFGLKVPPVVISEVGNIGRAHSNGVDHSIEFTRDLNQSAADFGHEDSCFWQSYYASRCTLKSEGGIGLRSFNEGGDRYGNGVTGRAWIFPLKQVDGSLVPTFNTDTPDAYVVFNGYGDLSGYTGARILAHMVGMTYRKVRFFADPIYVNSQAGYLVAPEEIAKNYTDGSLSLPTSDHSNLYVQERVEGVVAA